MSSAYIWQQLAQLLTQSPGNLIYHLVTLFALQAVFALAWNQWRQQKDTTLQRTAIAAAAIFLARVILLLTHLALQQNQTLSIIFLPPAEQVTHLATAVFLTWALIPASNRYPRLGDILLLIGLLLSAAMYIFFAPTWAEAARQGITFIDSGQAGIWGIAQSAVIVFGIILSFSKLRPWLGLPLTILILLLAANIANLLQFPQVAIPDTEIAYWVRLGHLIIFPLWAVLTYRHAIANLLQTQQRAYPLAGNLSHSLQLATNVIETLNPDLRLARALAMTKGLTSAVFTGIVRVNEQQPNQLHLTSNLSRNTEIRPRSWNLNLEDWPAFRLALEQKQAVDLLPNGLGARQLHMWYQEMGTPQLGPMLIQPLLHQEKAVGLLLLAGPTERIEWLSEERQTAAAVAHYLTQAIHTAQRHRELTEQAAQPLSPFSSESAVSGRIIALESERDQLLAELQTTQGRLKQAESQAMSASQQAQDLAQTMAELDQASTSHSSPIDQDRILELETEVSDLREALIEAEEAMAMAAAAEGGLSTEWVMLTITRYSGELEDAQLRIQMLEKELSDREQGPISPVLTGLIQEIRTPMTSIAGYTDLVMGEKIGELNLAQREFLQRVKANAERMEQLLSHIIQLVSEEESPAQPVKVLANVQNVLDMAVTGVINQIREKSLQLEMDISTNLPPLPVRQEDLSKIMLSLLSNACLASPQSGRVAVRIQPQTIANPDHEQTQQMSYLHIAIGDCGQGIAPADLPHVFEARHKANAPLIAGLGDTSAGLSLARKLTENNGGRLWVESVVGQGSTFSALFPFATRPIGISASTNGQLTTNNIS